MEYRISIGHIFTLNRVTDDPMEDEVVDDSAATELVIEAKDGSSTSVVVVDATEED